jgi:hypothetical protein
VCVEILAAIRPTCSCRPSLAINLRDLTGSVCNILGLVACDIDCRERLHVLRSSKPSESRPRSARKVDWFAVLAVVRFACTGILVAIRLACSCKPLLGIDLKDHTGSSIVQHTQHRGYRFSYCRMLGASIGVIVATYQHQAPDSHVSTHLSIATYRYQRLIHMPCSASHLSRCKPSLRAHQA